MPRYSQRARDVARATLKEFGRLIVAVDHSPRNPQPFPGRKTGTFGGFDTDMDLIFTHPSTQDEWSRQTLFINTLGAKSPTCPGDGYVIWELVEDKSATEEEC